MPRLPCPVPCPLLRCSQSSVLAIDSFHPLLISSGPRPAILLSHQSPPSLLFSELGLCERKEGQVMEEHLAQVGSKVRLIPKRFPERCQEALNLPPPTSTATDHTQDRKGK